MKFRKKAIATAMSVVLALGLCPAFALADDASLQAGDVSMRAQEETAIPEGTYVIDKQASAGMFKATGSITVKADTVDVHLVEGRTTYDQIALAGNDKIVNRGEAIGGKSGSYYLGELDSSVTAIEGKEVKDEGAEEATDYTFDFTLTKDQFEAALAEDHGIDVVLRYATSYTKEDHRGKWYVPTSQYTLKFNFELPTDLRPTNEEAMFVAVDADFVKEDGKSYLMLFMSGTRTNKLFVGTEAEAKALDENDEAWVGYTEVPHDAVDIDYVDYKGADVTTNTNTSFRQFKLDVTKYATETMFTVPLVQFADNLAIRRAEVDLEKGTMVLGSHKGTFEAAVTSSVADVKADSAASVYVEGYLSPGTSTFYKTSNEFLAQPTIKLTDKTYDSVKIVQYNSTKPGEDNKYETTAAESNAIAVAEDGTLVLPIENSYKNYYRTVDGKTATLKMHVSKDAAFKEADTWVERTIAIDYDAKTVAISGTALTAVEPEPEPEPEPAVTPLTKVERVSGADRYATMAKIVAAGFDKSDYAVIATGENFPDALAASALAGAYDCPVILTKKDELTKEAADTLKKLGVKYAHVMGGDAAIAPKTVKAIEDLTGNPVSRIFGETRQDTSIVALNATKAKNKGSVDTVIIATGEKFADTLSIGPWSYANSAPIVLTKADGTLTDAEVKAIKEAKPKKVVAVGGTAVVSDKVKTQLGMDVKRLYGETRYETSAAIAKWELENGMTLAAPAVATGENFPDALAGAALCGKNGSVMVLTSDKNQKALDKLKGAKGSYVFGGESAVSNAVKTKVENAVK